MNSLYFIIPMAFIIFSVWVAIKLVKRGFSRKKALIMQICSVAFFMVVSLFACGGKAVSAAANNTTTTTTTSNQSSSQSSSGANAYGIGLLAAALVTGLSGIGAGIAVASSGPAAIAATSENPKAFGKSIIIVALGEGVALYGVFISLMIFSKLDALLS